MRKKEKVYRIETEIYDDPRRMLDKLREVLLGIKNSADFPFSSVSEIKKWDGTEESFLLLKYKDREETFAIFPEIKRVEEGYKLEIRYVERDKERVNYLKRIARKCGIEFEEV